MAQELVYIAGVGHSGSTVLDLMLGGHPAFVGLGEVASLLNPDAERLNQGDPLPCACGEAMDTCMFWGPVLKRLQESSSRSLAERYGIVLEEFAAVFGKDRILVDSSKGLGPLTMLSEMPGMRVRVLYLVRDVRSWTVSIRDVRRRRNEFRLADLVRKFGLLPGCAQWPRRLATVAFWYWYCMNRRFTAFLEAKNIPYLRIGYEELALCPDQVVPEICRFLGVEVEEGMLRMDQSASHSILGNRMRLQTDKRRTVRYDCRWFWQNDWLLPAVLFPNIMRYNKRQTYQNMRGEGFWRQ